MQLWPSWLESLRTLATRILHVIRSLSHSGRWQIGIVLIMLTMIMTMITIPTMIITMITIPTMISTMVTIPTMIITDQDENKRVKENSIHFRKIVGKINKRADQQAGQQQKQQKDDTE